MQVSVQDVVVDEKRNVEQYICEALHEECVRGVSTLSEEGEMYACNCRGTRLKQVRIILICER